MRQCLSNIISCSAGIAAGSFFIMATVHDKNVFAAFLVVGIMSSLTCVASAVSYCQRDTLFGNHRVDDPLLNDNTVPANYSSIPNP